MLSYSKLKREKELEYNKFAPRKEVREYAPIWNQIKLAGECTITCAAEEKNKVKSGVIKEKHWDSEFKELGITKLHIVYTETGIHFTLLDYRPMSLLGVL